MPDKIKGMLFLVQKRKAFTRFFLRTFLTCIHTYSRYVLIKHFLHVYHNFSILINQLFQKYITTVYLTAVFFETGAMSTPTKSQNLTNCG